MIRLRFSFKKFGALRYISHLDLQKVWIRVLLRAKLPVAYTQGFHPSPKMGVAWPLPLGWVGLNELIDFWFDLPESEAETGALNSLAKLLNENSPIGLRINHVEPLPIYSPALTTLIYAADYSVQFRDNVQEPDLIKKIEQVLSQKSIIRTRRKKEYDLRTLIDSIIPDHDPQGNLMLRTKMAARDSAMGRPDELLDEMGLTEQPVRYTRERFYLPDSVIK